MKKICPWCARTISFWDLRRRSDRGRECPKCSRAVRLSDRNGLRAAFSSSFLSFAYVFAAGFRLVPFSDVVFYVLLALWPVSLLYVVNRSPLEKVNAV